MSLPLDSIRVLDLTRALAGPFCTMCLADFGADVIKIESLPKGDMTRGWGPYDQGIAAYYLSINRNKRDLAVNFRDPEALKILRRLALEVDVVVENFKPGRADEMDLGYDDLKEANPKLIYASITGFGRDGPYGNWPGFDQIAQGMSGVMSLTGYPDGEPTRAGVPFGDVGAGMWAAMGICAAVAQRHVTGKGQRVETSLLASLIGMLNVQGQRYLSANDVAGRIGNYHMAAYPYGTCEASDGQLNVGAATQDMWVKLCKLLDLDELIEHPDYIDNAKRMENRDALCELLNREFRTDTAIAWTHKLIAAGIPAGPVYSIDEVFADPQVVHQNMVEEIDHPKLGRIKQLSNPLRMDAFEGRTVRTPPPGLGEHTRAVLTEAGYSDAEIDALIEAGTVGE
ncbi:MAG: CoA transferase [Alphaproteobacteria bacterium]|nr:CoA transferase [Alphaproteobacteria bacterium]